MTSLSTTQVLFSMDSDAAELARADYGFLEITDTKLNKFVKENATVYALCANLWLLVAEDIVNIAFALRLRSVIVTTSLSQAIEYFATQADHVRANETHLYDPDIADAVYARGAANVIMASSFAKRFSTKSLNKLQGNPAAKFREFNKTLAVMSGSRRDGRKTNSPTFMSRALFHTICHAIKEKMVMFIGEGPDTTQVLPSVFTSPGTSLMEGGLTTKSPAEKMAAAKADDPSKPNFQLQYYRTYDVVDEWVWMVSLPKPNVDETKTPALKPFYRLNKWRKSNETSATVNLTPDPFCAADHKDPYAEEGHWYEPAHTDYVFTFHTLANDQDLRNALGRYGRFVAEEECVEGCWVRKQRWSAISVGPDYGQGWYDIVVEGVFIPPFNRVKECHGAEGHYVQFLDVPKSYNRRRGITEDRPERMSAQLTIKTRLDRKITSHPVLRTWLNLHDQGQNRELSRYGAAYGEFATTDISSASDWISLHLAWECIPGGWYRALLETRPTHFRAGDAGGYTPLSVLGPMGCGWTFIVESLFYLAVACVAYDYAAAYGIRVHIQSKMPPCFRRIARAVQRGVQWVTYNKWPIRIANDAGDPILVSVYGDDAIMPTEVAAIYIGLLEALGIEVNRQKSYLHGPFRESCGGDYYLDSEAAQVLPATPVYWPRSGFTCFEFDADSHKHVFCKDAFTRSFRNGEVVETTELSKLVDLQHALWDYSPRASAYLADVVKGFVPQMTTSQAGSTNSDLWGTVDHGVPGIFDTDTGRVRPLRDGESYTLVTDPESGEQVAVDEREMHLQPVTRYTDERYASTSARSAGDIDRLVDAVRLERALFYGGNYVADPATDVLILQAGDSDHLAYTKYVEWVLK